MYFLTDISLVASVGLLTFNALIDYIYLQDQPAPSPYPDWSSMQVEFRPFATLPFHRNTVVNMHAFLQAYYGPGVLPPTYFAPAIAPGHPPPYMWGPQVREFDLHLHMMFHILY